MQRFYQKLSLAVALSLLSFSVTASVTANEKELSDEELIQQLEERDKKVKQNIELLEKLGGNKQSQEESENNKAVDNKEEELSDDELIEQLGDRNQRIKGQIEQIKKVIGKDKIESEALNSTEETEDSLPAYVLISIAALIGVCAVPIIKYAGRSFIWGEASTVANLIESIRAKYGKPRVPTGVAFRHNKSLQELTTIGEKMTKVDDDKFDNKEFLLFVKIKIALSKEDPEYQALNHSAQLLRAGIVTQKSFLRIEQTELRFRSSKQQKLYNFVADNLTEDVDKQQFREGVAQKLAEILPLLNTEEGKTALQGYTKEINLISEHEFGLKLLRLFKQYELADYSILRTVSDIVDSLKGRDLRDLEELVAIVIENFETFDKIAPIIEIPPEQSEPKTHANLIRYIGLMNRHEKAYYDFSKLLDLMAKWRQPYKLLTTIRNEYTADNYRLPPEFKQDISGEYVYKKYEEYLEEKLAKKNAAEL